MNIHDIPSRKHKIDTMNAIESSKKKPRIVDDNNDIKDNQGSMGMEVIDSMSMNKKVLRKKTKDVMYRHNMWCSGND